MDQVFQDIPDEKRWIIEELEKYMGHVLAQFQDTEIKLSNWGKYRFIPVFEAESAKRAYRETELYRNAVLLVSYPRTGTNWTMEIVRQILYGHHKKLDTISKSVPPFAMTVLESWRPEKFDLVEHIPLPRKIFYSHLPVELMNLDTIKKYNGKIILLNRNPKDQLVSWYHYTQNKGFHPFRDIYSTDWNQFYADFIAGKQRTMMPEGEFYPEFLRDWYKHKDDKNVMLLTFENLKNNYESEIKNIAKFLDVKISDERAAEIAASTAFGSMRKTQENAEANAQKLNSSMQMVRKGKVGSWKELFTVAQSEQMDRIMEDRLRNTNIKFTYE